MTTRIEPTPATAVTSMIQINGYAPVSVLSNAPVRMLRPAPPPIMIAPPKPDAVPARCGRTDSRPAVALGMDSPFPNPTSVIMPKNASGDPKPARNNSNDKTPPSKLAKHPKRTSLLTP